MVLEISQLLISGSWAKARLGVSDPRAKTPMDAAIHKFGAVHPDRELSVALVQAQIRISSGHLRAVEKLPGNHGCLKDQSLHFYGVIGA